VSRAAWAWLGVGLAFVAVVAWFVVTSIALDPSSDDSSHGALRVVSTGTATAPFTGLTVTRLALDGDCKHLVVADDLAERVAGLRGRTETTPYDGMLFVFDGPTTASFTMAGVTEPLDIAFYDGAGKPVSRSHMTPCDNTEARCPVYEADAPFVYALETAPGGLAGGALSNCPS
jgi:uncharacterized membrane protein (UPF0127 family)